MSPAAKLKDRIEVTLTDKFGRESVNSSERPTVLIATIDPDICSGLTDLFKAMNCNVIWLKSVEAAKRALVRGDVAACLCGLWLQDGTFRQLVRHIRRERPEVRTIIVSAPSSSNEYGDYLAAARIDALDFLSHPYRTSDLEKMLNLTMDIQARSLDEEAYHLGMDYHSDEAA